MGVRACAIAAVLGTLLGGCDMSRQDSNQLVVQALDHVRADNVLDAVRRLNDAVATDPTNGPAHYYLGMLRLQKYSDARSAAQHLRDAVERLPEVAEIHYQLGLALMETGETSAAGVSFEQAVALDAEHGRALYRLATLDEQEGRVRDAIDRYTRAIHVRPRLAPAYAGLGSLYARYGRPREAVAVFRNCIQNENPNDDETRAARAQCRSEMGRIQFEQGELDEAVQYLREAVTLRPESPSVQFNLGLALRARYAASGAQADRDAALMHLQRASGQCNPTAERARCESIQAALQELRETPSD